MPQPTTPPNPAQPHQPTGAERRTAARHASALLGSCRPVNSPQGQLWTCQIEDISLGGISVVLRRRFEPGTVIVVEPFSGRAEAAAGLLARVVRVRAQDRDLWSHGCQFVKDLTEEDLMALQHFQQPACEVAPAAHEADARPDDAGRALLEPGACAGAERRAHVRFSHRLKSACRTLGDEAAAWTATVENLSRTGAALRMSCEARRGAVLVVALEGLGGRFSRPVLMRVMNSRRVAGGCWHVGCAFVKALTENELQALLLAPES